jgi:putative acetyltransferase
MQSVNRASSWEIRRLQLSDLPQILEIIENVRREFGLAERVTALLEAADYSLLEVYRHRRSAYFVALGDGDVVGGAGIYPLVDGDWATCELQRMYVRRQSRGRGTGQALLDACLEAARALGFERCYAETIAEMTTAIGFYERNGFYRLAAPLGETGHGHNDRWLLLDIPSMIKGIM